MPPITKAIPASERLIFALDVADPGAARRLVDTLDDSVQFYWDEICKGTIAEGAQLHFRHVEAQLQCMACFTAYHPVEQEIRCPSCGSSGAKIVAGEEFFLESLDVE